MQFDQTKAMMAFLSRLKVIFSDPKSLDSAVYRSGSIEVKDEGPIALSTTDLLKIWTAEGQVDAERASKLSVKCFSRQQSPFEAALYDVIREKGLSQRQVLCFYAAILSAYQSVKEKIESTRLHWSSKLLSHHAASKEDSAIQMLSDYAEKQLAHLPTDIEHTVLDWARQLAPPLFTDEAPEQLASACFDSPDELAPPVKVYELIQQERFSSLESLLLAVCLKKVDSVFLFGQSASSYFPLSLITHPTLSPPFDSLDLSVMPIAQVGRIITFQVKCLDHTFCVHSSSVSDLNLTKEESAYLVNQKEGAKQGLEHVLEVNANAVLYPSEVDEKIDLESPVRVLLYHAAIGVALKTLEDKHVTRENPYIQDEITTLGAIQNMLSHYDTRRLSKLKACEHIHDSLKIGAPDDIYPLLSYLLESLDANVLIEQPLLFYFLFDPRLLTPSQSNMLQVMLIQKIGQDTFESLSPLLLRAVVGLYQQCLDGTLVETAHQKRLKQSLEMITKGFASWTEMQLLSGNRQVVFQSFAIVNELLNQYCAFFDDVAHEEKARLITLQRALLLADSVPHDDYVALLQLEHKLIEKWGGTKRGEEAFLSLSEDENALLLDYDDYFQGIEDDSQLTSLEKRTYLQAQMKKAREDYISQASTAPDQVLIRKLNTQYLVSLLNNTKYDDPRAFIADRKVSNPSVIERSVPLKQGEAKKHLFIKIDDYQEEHLPVINQLIALASIKGVESVKFVSSHAKEKLIQQIVIPEKVNSFQYFDGDIERAWLNAKVGTLENESLFVSCESQQDPVNALLVAGYALGGFNEVISFFNGEVDSFNSDELIGFKQYGFKYSPLIGLYRPKWLCDRVSDWITPAVHLKKSETLFFDKQVLPFMPEGLLKRSYLQLAPFYQQYVQYVFAKHCAAILPKCSREDKSTLIHVVMTSLIQIIANHKESIHNAEVYHSQINETALKDYRYYASSSASSLDWFVLHLSAIREDLYEPIDRCLTELSTLFKAMLSGYELKIGQLDLMQRQLDQVTSLVERYQAFIPEKPADPNYALIKYLSRAYKQMMRAPLWQSIAHTSWHDLPELWQIDIFRCIRQSLDDGTLRSDKRQRFVDAMLVFNEKVKYVNQVVFSEALGVYERLKKEIIGISSENEKRVYCNLLFDAIMHGNVFSETPENKGSLVKKGCFASNEAYIKWRQEEKNALVQMMADISIDELSGAQSIQFLENLLRLLIDDELDVNLRVMLTDSLCEKISTMSLATKDLKLLLGYVSDLLENEQLPRDSHDKIINALYQNLHLYKKSIVYPNVLTGFHWSEKIDSVLATLQHFYELVSYFSQVASPEKVALLKQALTVEACDYFSSQLDKLEKLTHRQLNTQGIDALNNRLDVLEAFASFFETHEKVSFQRLKASELRILLEDMLPSDSVLRRGERQVNPAASLPLSSKAINRYLLRPHHDYPVISSSGQEQTAVLEQMYQHLIREGNQLCHLFSEQDQMTSLPALLDYVLNMTTVSQLATFELSDLDTLFQIKQFLTKLYHYSFEQGVDTIISQKSDGKHISPEQIKERLTLVDKYHAKVFLLGLRRYIEKQAKLKKWGVGLQKDPSFITVSGQSYRVPRRVGMQYQAIQKAFPDESDTHPDYVAIEEALLNTGSAASNRHAFWSSAPSKAYWQHFRLPRGSREDIERQLTENLGLVSLTSNP